MTTLRSFQTEIDEIQHRETARQRTQTAVDKGKEKEVVKSAFEKSTDSNSASSQGTPADGSPELSDVDEQLQTLLLSNVPSNHDRARDVIASLLTRYRGEYILRIGAHPPHPKLFTDEALDIIDTEAWRGTRRTAEELDVVRGRVGEIVDEVGGKTTVLVEGDSAHPRATLLLRLPPTDISLTPEVRCAVVGNVDSGKSTTLGVLTRGSLDDGRGRARVSLFRHKHEIESGRTSSVGMEVSHLRPLHRM